MSQAIEDGAFHVLHWADISRDSRFCHSDCGILLSDRCSGLRSVKCGNPALLMGVIWAENTAIYDKVRCTAASSGVSDLVMWGKVMFMMGAVRVRIVAVRRRTVNPGDYPKYIRGRVEIPAGFTSIEDDGDLDWVYWWSRSLRYYYSSHN